MVRVTPSPGGGKRALGRNQSGSARTESRAADGVEIDFLKGWLAAHRGRADAAGTTWQAGCDLPCISARGQESAHPDDGPAMRCADVWGGKVSRAGFIGLRSDRESLDQDLDLRDEIQRIALEFPCWRPSANHGRTEAARAHGRWDIGGSAASCARIIYFICGGANS